MRRVQEKPGYRQKMSCWRVKKKDRHDVWACKAKAWIRDQSEHRAKVAHDRRRSKAPLSKRRYLPLVMRSRARSLLSNTHTRVLSSST